MGRGRDGGRRGEQRAQGDEWESLRFFKGEEKMESWRERTDVMNLQTGGGGEKGGGGGSHGGKQTSTNTPLTS